MENEMQSRAIIRNVDNCHIIDVKHEHSFDIIRIRSMYPVCDSNNVCAYYMLFI
jgi:hypothetical protein